jgi:transposase
MARSYSQDLRERVLDEALGGGSARGAAACFGIGAATAITWARRARDTGERTAQRQGHPPGSKLDDEADYLLELIDRTPDLTLEEIRARLKHERGLDAGTTTIWRFFNARGITFKKNRARGRARQTRCG